MNNGRSLLLVDDDLLDVKNMRRALAKTGTRGSLHVVPNGAEALSYLTREETVDAISSSPRPDLILMDIRMPVMSGLEFLKAYKSMPGYQSIPAIVLTTSDQSRDREESFRLGAAGYFLKSSVFSEFVEIVRRIELYWSACRLPKASGIEHG